MEVNKKPIYPVEAWKITEKEFKMETNYRNETTFALSNGYIGTRGTFEEGYDFSVDEGLEGNFINGFYESEDIRYGEWNYGFPERSQSLLNVPGAKTTEIYLDGERFDMRAGTVSEYERVLHMDEGVLTRRLIWTSPEGRKAGIWFERFVSFARKNVLAQRVKVTPLEGVEEIRFVSCLDGEVENHTRKTNPLVDYGPFGRRIDAKACAAGESAPEHGADGVSDAAAGLLYFEGETKKSGLALACGVCHSAEKMPGAKVCCHTDGEYKARAEYVYKVPAEKCAGNEAMFDKFIIYTTSLDMDREQMRPFVETEASACLAQGYDGLKEKQIIYMKEFWRLADIRVDGDTALQQGLRFNLFHIMQAAGRDGRTGMGAKGLSGEGYEGHYFWDTEMYVLPVFIYTAPEVAKELLLYRYHTLDAARERARVLGHPKGALYPWRTINGEEASTYFPLGTAQYHINADIAYAFQLYVHVTGDREFFRDVAAEVLCETARVWADVGCFAECKGNRYCICAVTGPDEYNAIVDNNFYTNLMARENIRGALKALETLEQYGTGTAASFRERLDITEEETVYWQRIVDNMYFPYDEKRGVYPLDDRFLMLKPWEDASVPPEKRHLLYENYHPLFVYRQRMSKQADAILGMYLYSSLFTKEELKRNYDFYQEVTLHHSSLSTCIFGILACEIGYYDEAYTYFSQSARMDLDDYHDNFYAGIHAANMAGTWQAIVNGFAGVRCHGDVLRFHPYLPKAWESYSFKMRYRGCVLGVSVGCGAASFVLEEGECVTFYIGEREVKITEKGGRHIEEI